MAEAGARTADRPGGRVALDEEFPLYVPAGVPHSGANIGTADIDGIVELRPARHSKEWHEALAGLAADFRTTPGGTPRNLLQALLSLE